MMVKYASSSFCCFLYFSPAKCTWVHLLEQCLLQSTIRTHRPQQLTAEKCFTQDITRASSLLLKSLEFKSSVTQQSMSKQQKRVNEKKLSDSPPRKTMKSNMSWTYHHVEQVYVGIFGESKSSEKLACFDFDGTLSLPKSGNKFPKNADDCMLLDDAIVPAIKSYHESGYRFVIFTNQSGVTSKNTTIEDVKSRIQLILEEIAVPCIVLAAVYKNAYRKPRTGMMDLFLANYNDGKVPSLADSFFVGDGAGRLKTKQRPKDHTDADYFFAINTGLQFVLPEQFIAKQDIAKAAKENLATLPNNKFHPKNLKSKAESAALEVVSGDKLSLTDLPAAIEAKRNGKKTLLVVMTGLPGSGKSSLARKLLPDATIISRDSLGTMDKVEKQLIKLIDDACKTILVDNTNTKADERQRWTKHAKDKSVSLVAIYADATADHCLHNNAYRRLVQLQSNPEMDVSKAAMVPTFVIGKMAKTMELPSAKEGFSAVFKVKFISQFECASHEKLYFQYLY